MEMETFPRPDLSGSIKSEFETADFGDDRLTVRLQKIGSALGNAPAASIPNACEDWASVKGTYRFCDNENVDPKEILEAHGQAQCSRLKGADELLLVSDTTHLTFPSHPSKEGLGDVGTDEMDLEGAKIHTTIGLLPSTGYTAGILDQQVLLEDREKDEICDTNGRGEPAYLESEREKWIRGDRRASGRLPEEVVSLKRSGQPKSMIEEQMPSQSTGRFRRNWER
jgi:hypothetical protein